MFLQPFFEWCDRLAMSEAYRESLYLFAVTQSLHLLAVTVFIGAILIVDLRLLGWGPVGQSRAAIARSAQRILLWAGLAILVTGIPQFTTNALSYSRSPVFVFKMCLLAATLVFTATVRRRVALADRRTQYSGGGGSFTSIGSPTGSPLNMRASVKNPDALRTSVTDSLPSFFQYQPCRPGYGAR